MRRLIMRWLDCVPREDYSALLKRYVTATDDHYRHARDCGAARLIVNEMADELVKRNRALENENKMLALRVALHDVSKLEKAS